MASHGSCGVAWVGGSNGAMSAGHKAYMFAHVAINSCGDFVTAHELGHRDTNMLYRHYRELVTQLDAREFWSIRPKT